MSSPIMRLYPNGVSYAQVHAGKPPGVKRGNATGWNSHTASRFRQWLMSIDIDALLRDGMALWGFTLTIAETPSSPEAWAGIREKWFKRVDRRLPGCRWVWITEFQRRGTPHLHGVLVAPANVGDTVRQLCYGDWPEVASAAGERKTLARAQYVTEIYSASGWLQYLTKHLQRGPNHYQRNRLPDG